MIRRAALLTLIACTALAQQKKDGGATAPVPTKPAAALSLTEGFSTPESVFYDAETDTYLVSNINGAPPAKDNNGFITELAPDGTVITAKLVEGGQKGVTLNGPKGLAVSQGVLYVADIDTVRLFDRKTGAAKGEVKVPGATFVNDLFSTADGKVYLTDSGLKAGKAGFEPSGTDAVYVIEPGKKPKLKTLLKSKDLKGPNGVLVVGDTLYVSTFGANLVHVLDLAGKKKAEPLTTPKGGLDGLVLIGERLFVSSWEGKAVFAAKPGEAFVEVFSDLNAPADIGFDSKRSLVLVPHFVDNSVAAWGVK